MNIKTRSGKQLRKLNIIEHLLQTNSVSIESPDAGGSLQSVEVLRNSTASATNTAKWVADSTLGVAWEQIDRRQEPHRYWVNHRDKLISLSHPSELVPMPGRCQT